MIKEVALAVLLSFLAGGSAAQGILEQKLDFSVSDMPLENALLKLIDRYDIKLSFSSEILPEKTIDLQMKGQQLSKILQALLEDTGIHYRVIGKQVVLFRPDPPPPVQQRFTISGYLQDAETGERLIGGSVWENQNQKGALSNEYGFFSLTVPEGKVSLQWSYLGYAPESRSFVLRSDTSLTMALRTDLTLTEIVVIGTDPGKSGLSSGSSTDLLNLADINNLPQLAGEPDLVRTAYLLPGVQTGADGIGGMYVRGGDVGHNLILIDGVPVYNISHAAGLFSIFNTSAIRSAKLVKAGFPARYSGRLASVLDVRTKEGNLKEFHGQADLGILTGRLSLEGPVQQNKSSFFVSGRWSYLNWYLGPITRDYKSDRGENGRSRYDFYDWNAKWNYAFSKNDKVYFSWYQGKDLFHNNGRTEENLSLEDEITGETFRFRFDQSYQETLNWGNTVGALRWNHLFSPKLFANTVLTFSKLWVHTDYQDYDSLLALQPDELIGKSVDFGQFQSSIEDVGVKIDLEYFPAAAHFFRFGAGITRHRLSPGIFKYSATSEEIDVEGAISNSLLKATEGMFYLEDEWALSGRLRLNGGINASIWGTEDKTYVSLQPRISGFWSFANRWGWKLSYSRMTQFLHLLSSSTLGLPTDLWVASTASIKPQQAWQIASGVEFQPAGWGIHLEGYYKKMDDLLNYTEGAIFLNNWEQNVTSGQGWAYGLELMLRKRAGKTTGWLAYSLAWSERQFEKVNFGRRYPFRFDRRHDLKLAFVHTLNHWLDLSGNWVWSSGLAYSLPLEQYVAFYPGVSSQPVIVLEYGSKNQYRLPYYHRLDLSLNAHFQTGGLSHGINLGAYNIYNQKNPLYYHFRNEVVNENNQLAEKKEFVQVWLLPFLPSFSYSLKF